MLSNPPRTVNRIEASVPQYQRYIVSPLLGKDKELRGPAHVLGVSARSVQGQIQGGAKIGQEGSLSLKNS